MGVSIRIWATAAAVALLSGGCFEPGGDGEATDAGGGGTGGDAGNEPEPSGPTPVDCTDDSLVDYRDDLAAHPGCTTDALAYEPADIAGYRCAAKAYPVDDEDASTPVVLLIHGNSDGTGGWESFEDPSCDPRGPMQGEPMLAERLSSTGFRVYAIDMRHDLTVRTGNDPDDCMGPGCNTAHSMDHGWSVPLVMHFVRSVLAAHPERQISLVGHSFGVTTIRDALRRLHVEEGEAVLERVDDVVLLSGGNHGVSTACGFAECGVNTTMRGRAACQIGNRDAWEPNCWSTSLNGPDGAWETPCSDGSSAFGEAACGGHSVEYTTIVMRDLPDGAQQDLCVSEQASMLKGADNRTIALTSYDESDYFLCGLLKNHFGSQRSLEAMQMIIAELSD